jgi:hypothetical protein
MNIKTPELFNSVNTQTHIVWSEGEEGDFYEETSITFHRIPAV